jgi:hypothetical protein
MFLGPSLSLFSSNSIRTIVALSLSLLSSNSTQSIVVVVSLLPLFELELKCYMVLLFVSFPTT